VAKGSKGMNNGLLWASAPALFAFLVCSTVQATEPSDLGCDGSTIEQSQCLNELRQKADKELNVTYQSLIGLVRNHGEEWVQDLRAAQRKWIEYRDLNCEFFSNYLKGGTGAGPLFGACQVRMTRERAAELQEERQELIRRGYQERQ